MDCLHEWDGWQQQSQVGLMAQMGLALSHTKTFEDRYFQAGLMAQQIMHDDAVKGQKYDPQVALWQVAELYCMATKERALQAQIEWMQAVMPKLIEAWCDEHGIDYRLCESRSDKAHYCHPKRGKRPGPNGGTQLDLYSSTAPVQTP